MGFFQNLFHITKPSRSAVLIDIDASSVAGAYAYSTEGEKSKIIYTRTLPIEVRTHESHEEAMARTLLELGNTLIREGALLLTREVGQGSADRVLVSIDAPWAEVEMRTKHLHQRDPFLFTKELVAEALEDVISVEPSRLRTDESIVGTVLNGYETRDPYGKNAHRASITTLASRIDENIADSVIVTLRSLFHTDRISLIARDSLRHQAMRGAFPHEQNACILDATVSPMTLALAHKNILVSITKVPDVATAASEIRKLAERYVLPRTLFLLVDEPEDSSLRQTLGAANLNPLTIVSVRPHHLSSFVTHAAPTPPDTSLLLMALFNERASSSTSP